MGRRRHCQDVIPVTFNHAPSSLLYESRLRPAGVGRRRLTSGNWANWHVRTGVQASARMAPGCTGRRAGKGLYNLPGRARLAAPCQPCGPGGTRGARNSCAASEVWPGNTAGYHLVTDGGGARRRTSTSRRAGTCCCRGRQARGRGGHLTRRPTRGRALRARAEQDPAHRPAGHWLRALAPARPGRQRAHRGRDGRCQPGRGRALPGRQALGGETAPARAVRGTCQNFPEQDIMRLQRRGILASVTSR